TKSRTLIPMLAIRSHLRPTGKRLDGIYRFAYERELKGIGGEFPPLRITKKPLRSLACPGGAQARFGGIYCCERRRRMLAARFTRIAIPSQINQLDSGPLLNMNVFVQPKFAAKLQAASV